MNKDELKKILSSTFKVRESELADSATINDIPGWDSMSHMDLVLNLENTFSIKLDGDEIADMQSVKAIFETLKKHGVEIS